MSEWFYAEGNRQQGPLAADRIVELFRSNQIGLDTLVWRDGLPAWQPLRTVVDELGLIVPALDAGAVPPLPPAGPVPPTLPPQAPSNAYASARAASIAPPPKKGMSGCLIAVIVCLVLAVPVLAILAAIALPAYQEYTLRAKVANATTQLRMLQPQVVEFIQTHDRCPGGNDDFPLDGLTGAGAPFSAVHVGRFNNGHCGIEATLSIPGARVDGDMLWMEFDRDSSRWECSGESDDKFLTGECRG